MSPTSLNTTYLARLKGDSNVHSYTTFFRTLGELPTICGLLNFFYTLLHPVLYRFDVPAMSIFSYIRSIYALDTIDTRFTTSSSSPYKDTIDARVDPASSIKRDQSIPGVGVRTDHSGRPIAQPSKWKTPEFYFYYFVFITVVPYMFWVAYDVSKREHR